MGRLKILVHLIPAYDVILWSLTDVLTTILQHVEVVAKTRRDTRTSENQQKFFKINKRFFVICVSWLNFHLCRVNMVPHLFQWCYKFIYFNNLKNNNYKYETLLVRGCPKVIILFHATTSCFQKRKIKMWKKQYFHWLRVDRRDKNMAVSLAVKCLLNTCIDTYFNNG